MKLVAIDLDGTLLSQDGKISEENRLALIEAQKHDCLIVISSGRALHDIQQILKSNRVDFPIISGNGAIIYYDGKIIYKKTMPSETLATMVTLLKNNDYYFELLTEKSIMAEHNGKNQLKAELSRVQEQDPQFPMDWAARQLEIQSEQHGIQYVTNFQDVQFSKPSVYKIFVYSFDRQKIHDLRETLKGRTDLSITSSGWTKAEIAHPEASKGNALGIIASHFRIPLSDTIAIGDNLNDLSMFQSAGIGIAMGNANEDLKKHSTFTTLSNEKNGVAYAINNFILKQRAVLSVHPEN